MGKIYWTTFQIISLAENLMPRCSWNCKWHHNRWKLNTPYFFRWDVKPDIMNNVLSFSIAITKLAALSGSTWFYLGTLSWQLLFSSGNLGPRWLLINQIVTFGGRAHITIWKENETVTQSGSFFIPFFENGTLKIKENWKREIC